MGCKVHSLRFPTGVLIVQSPIVQSFGRRTEARFLSWRNRVVEPFEEEPELRGEDKPWDDVATLPLVRRRFSVPFLRF